MSSWKARAKENPWRNDIFILLDCPRNIAVAAFRLKTGHDLLYAHLCRFRIVNNPSCPLCCSGVAMNDEHVPECPALTKKLSISAKS
ncbi:hypothetical protein NPIL_325761 [Nephila pilipes]|uniref:Uncharacterized protein n=1 Tax=Nephila pilipes TaxID=299642 RepID=A0A8X6U402_NEPPI|nr:hypothetical protein NPIL_325761 [Nephila pilipes]